MPKKTPIPIIDLFAGPGGLGEGFSSYPMDNDPAFKICLSFEMETWAHRTLLLRSFYRHFAKGQAPEDYYQYLRGDLSRDELFKRHPQQFEWSREQSQCIEIGPDNRRKVKRLIADRVRGFETWVLIGGPPCQAYSLVGRSRLIGADRRHNTNKYETDPRHTLYKEYLRIIADHWPPFFVMENVRGLLSSRLNGKFIFPRMLADLRDPGKTLRRPLTGRHRYEVLSFVTQARGGSDLKPVDYVIRTEDHGLPQSRHRLILLGVREDFLPIAFDRLHRESAAPIEDALSDMPPVRSGLSRTEDGLHLWKSAILEVLNWKWLQKLWNDGDLYGVAQELDKAVTTIQFRDIDRGREFVPTDGKPRYQPDWFCDSRLGGLCNHTARIHIKADLHRYLFAACYARVVGKSPVLRDYPGDLLPTHRNAQEAVKNGTFDDRFRVQIRGRPSTTITSHMAKDGHHFIHFDPTQCRSLTVREAARLQTFPDNYFFEGPRSAQYIQVGNAVPPLLDMELHWRSDADRLPTGALELAQAA